MNENNSQCDDVGCKEAIEFIHNLLDRAMRSKHFNTVQYFRDFLKINIYIWISKTFTFASINFQPKLLHAANLDIYLFLGISSVNLFLLLLHLGVYV